MIAIIVAPIGKGKTSYMTARLAEAAFDVKRALWMQRAIEKINFENHKKFSVPASTVAANFPLKLKARGKDSKQSYFFDAEKIGLPSIDKEAVSFAPYTTIGIMEAQNYFCSHDWQKLSRTASAFFEWSRHFGLNIWLDTQNLNLIDKNIRSLAQVHVIKDRVVFDERGKVVTGFVRPRDFGKISWKIKIFENINDYENDENGVNTLYTTENNVFKMYDSKENSKAFLPLKGGFNGAET